MPLKDFARFVRDDVLPRERLRRAQPHALVASGVKVMGDVSRITLDPGANVHGPTVLSVEDGGGLHGSRLIVGARTYIGEFNNIRCAGAAVTIGADCLVSQFVTVVGTNHATEPGATIASQGWSGAGIAVGNDVWIGAGAVLLPGTDIGDGAVVAANSVVRGRVEAGEIVGGTPARHLGERAPHPVR